MSEAGRRLVKQIALHFILLTDEELLVLATWAQSLGEEHQTLRNKIMNAPSEFFFVQDDDSLLSLED